MKKKLCAVMLIAGMLSSSMPAYASHIGDNVGIAGESFISSAADSYGQPIMEDGFDENVRDNSSYSYKGETNFENIWVRNLTDTKGRSVSTKGEAGKFKIIIYGRVTKCGLTINATDYLAECLGSNSKVEIITRDCDDETTSYLRTDIEDKRNGSDGVYYNWMFANYDKVHITGGSNGNDDMWGVVRKLSGSSGMGISLPVVTVVDSQNIVKYCSVGYTGDELESLVGYVKSMVGDSEQPNPPTPSSPPTPSNPPAPSEPEFFSDVTVAPGNWKYDSIKYVYDNGIMNGISGTTRFDPDKTMTRAMFATVLYRMAGEPAVQYESKFQDVSNGRYYSNAIIWAYKQGIVQGMDGGIRYGINENITREQMAKMLMEYARVRGYSTNEKADLNGFPDKNDVSGWAAGYMQWAVGCGMISGKNINGAYYLDPKGNATRAECAAMLMRFMKRYQ